MTMTDMLLSCRKVDVSIGGKAVVQNLNLDLPPGCALAILGRNGSGKTTLLHTLAGLRPVDSGRIELLGRSYPERDAREVARLRGVLAQSQGDAFPATVMETALIGRHPHLGRWAWETAEDHRLARAALAAVGLSGLEEREIHSLSGGERQRLAIATLLTQAPSLFLLDEPTTYLDLNHQIAMLDLLVAPTQAHRPEQAGFALVLHDVNLALRYCQRVLLLFGDGRWSEGPTDTILTAPLLSELYGYPLQEVLEGGRHFMPANSGQ